jgi:hypothetical protein
MRLQRACPFDRKRDPYAVPHWHDGQRAMFTMMGLYELQKPSARIDDCNVDRGRGGSNKQARVWRASCGRAIAPSRKSPPRTRSCEWTRASGSGPSERHQGSHKVQAGRLCLCPRLWRQSASLEIRPERSEDRGCCHRPDLREVRRAAGKLQAHSSGGGRLRRTALVTNANERRYFYFAPLAGSTALGSFVWFISCVDGPFFA